MNIADFQLLNMQYKQSKLEGMVTTLKKANIFQLKEQKFQLQPRQFDDNVA